MKNKIIKFGLLLCFLLLGIHAFGFQETEQTQIIIDNSEAKSIGFLATFVRTPFVLFCFMGTITGVVLSAIIEFIYNIFAGFDRGFPNLKLIWDLGWRQIIGQWYWQPSVWWHVLISVIVWSPLLKRKKSE